MNGVSHDVVIVGAGPGGTAAGIVAARAGLSTLIVDKAQFPRDKACGGLLSAKSTTLLETLLEPAAFERAVRSRHNGFRMFHKGRLLSEVTHSEPVCSVSRRELDLQLFQAAQAAGCRVQQGAQGRRDRISGECDCVGIGPTHPGAFDRRGRRARSVMRCDSQKQGTGLGLVTEIPIEFVKDEGERRLLCGEPNIFFGDIPWGYGWIFPQGEVLNVGIGAKLSVMPHFRQAIDELIRAHFREGTIGRIKLRGHLLPFGRFQRRPGQRNVLTVGDAAGLVEPLTGEGIAYALQSGILAGEAIRAAAAQGNYSFAGDIYNAMLQGPVIRPLRQAALSRWLFFPRPCFPLAMRGLARHPEIARWYWELLAGKLTYPQFWSRMVTVFW